MLVTDRIPSVTVQGRRTHQVGLPYHWGQRLLTTGDTANDLMHMALDPNVHIQEVKAATCGIRPGRRPRGKALVEFVAAMRERAGASHERAGRLGCLRRASSRSASASSPTRRSASAARRARSRARSGTSSRRTARRGPASRTTTRRRSARTRGATSRSSSRTSRCVVEDGEDGLRWLMESDVCKHCTHAACLDVCPTGALFRTEFGTVVVQEDICNGCGYCVPACPFGVLDKRHIAKPPELPALHGEGGRARLEVHALLRPPEGRPRARVREGVPDAVDPVRAARRAARARRRAAREACRQRAGTARSCTAATRRTASAASARSSCCSTIPEVYGLPPDPVVTTKHLGGDVARTWRPRRQRSPSASSARFSEGGS